MFRDTEACLRAVQSKDARFDGQFFTAVTSTGIYCRPSCPVVPPKPRNMRFLPSAAAAQAEGFRACKRCRPDAAPGSPEWDVRGDLVGRALRLINDGVVDRHGVPGLASRLGYSRRQVERHLLAELGASPLALARTRRAQTGRLLIETTDLPMGEVAFAAGFGSVRQFNDTIQAVYATAPSELRTRARRSSTTGTQTALGARNTSRPGTGNGIEPGPGNGTEPGATGPGPGENAATSTSDRAATGTVPPGTITVRLAHRAPLWPDSLFGHLVATAVPGVEEWRDGAYRRTLRLPHGPGIVALRPADGFIGCDLTLSDLRDFPVAVARCRRLLDLDADPVAVDAALSADPVLAPLVAAAPGRRVPRTVDEDELALRVVLGQQVSTAAARTHAARLVAVVGEPVTDHGGGLTHLFPTPEAVAAVDPAELRLPGSRKRTLVALADALADGRVSLGPGSDATAARAALLALPGVGPWTADTVAMRALGDPDVFLAGDLGIRAAAGRLGLATDPRELAAHAQRWRPWRSYAVQHLWGTGDHPVNRLPS